MNNIEFNQAIVTIAEATVAASKFPGVRIAATQEEWMYDISTPDEGYDRHGVALEHLVVEVNNTVIELQSSFGEHGEGLADLVLNVHINA